MPFAFIFVGAVFLASGILGTTSQLTSLLKSDLTGQGNYIYWALSILLVGAIGYVDDLKPLSRAFLTLLLVVLILSNGGFFQLFDEAIAVITGSPEEYEPYKFPGFGGGRSGGGGANS